MYDVDKKNLLGSQNGEQCPFPVVTLPSKAGKQSFYGSFDIWVQLLGKTFKKKSKHLSLVYHPHAVKSNKQYA